MLTLTFLGVGSAFAKRNLNSNCLFEFWEKPWQGDIPAHPPDDTLLVDFGVTGPMALYQLKDKPGFEYLERSSGSFLRRFSLPENAQAEQIKARHTNGVLEVVIPKQTAPEPRRINVEVN